MKKIISLKTTLLMGLAIGSSLTIDAYNNTNKYASKDTKKSAKKSSSEHRASMKSIENDLYKIKQDFKKNHDAAAAHAKLEAMPAMIKSVVAEMKKSENHGKLWETHEHTLNRKLREVREFVKNHAKK